MEASLFLWGILFSLSSEEAEGILYGMIAAFNIPKAAVPLLRCMENDKGRDARRKLIFRRFTEDDVKREPPGDKDST